MGRNSRKRTPRAYPEDRRLNGRPRVAAGSATHQHREAAGERPEEPEKTLQTTETTYQKDQGREGKGGPEKKAQTPSAALGSTGSSASWTATTEKRRRRAEIGRGPAPEVSCNPPAEHPRPPFALQRETYRLELRGSCGRVQAIIINIYLCFLPMFAKSFRYSCPSLKPNIRHAVTHHTRSRSADPGTCSSVNGPAGFVSSAPWKRGPLGLGCSTTTASASTKSTHVTHLRLPPKHSGRHDTPTIPLQ